MFKKPFHFVRNIKEQTFICWVLIGAAVYTVLPFLLLAQFNQPSADDYTLAVRDMNNSLPVVLKDVYANWSGRFLAPVFSRLNPLLYDVSWYRIYPLVLIIGFIISIVIVFRELLKPHYSFLEILAISSLFIHLVFSQTPSISEAFYWFSGSCIYQTANIFTLLLITILSKSKKVTSAAVKTWYGVLAALLCIVIIGSNEVSMVVVFFIVFGVTVNDLLNKKKADFLNLALLLVCIVCGMVVFFAPGNLSRMDDPVFYNKSLVWTIFGAASVSLLYVFKWATSLLAATLIYLVFVLGKLENNLQPEQGSFAVKRSVSYFVAVVLLLQLIIIYIAGGGNLGRIENNVYLLVLIGYFFNLHLFLDKFLRRRVLPFPFKKMLVLFSMLFFLFDVFNLENNTSSAYVDIISGRAKKYRQELDERIALVKACKTDTCYAPALSAIPKSLFVTEIRLRSDSMFLWINKGYSEFYHASFILPSGTPPPIEPNVEIIRHLGKEIRKNMVEK